MREFVHLQVNQHIAAQQTIVEYQINIKVFFLKAEALLSGFKQETFTQLQ